MIKRKFPVIPVLGGLLLLVVVLYFTLHCFVEGRKIPSTSMQPTLVPGDRIILEKVSKCSGHQIERGTIVCFTLPECYSSASAATYFEPARVLGRLTGLPIFPQEIVFIKRIIAIGGDRVRVEPNLGVFVNEKLLEEQYISSPASYRLAEMADIGGRSISGSPIRPYGENHHPLIVPKGMVFVLGDDRNRSEDSHVFGFVSEDTVVGKAWYMISPLFQDISRPFWKRPAEARQ